MEEFGRKIFFINRVIVNLVSLYNLYEVVWVFTTHYEPIRIYKYIELGQAKEPLKSYELFCSKTEKLKEKYMVWNEESTIRVNINFWPYFGLVMIMMSVFVYDLCYRYIIMLMYFFSEVRKIY